MTGDTHRTCDITRHTVDPMMGSRLTKFIDAHVHTPAHRSIFRTLATSAHEVWTVEALAEWTKLEPYDVDVVMREFAAVGIAESVGDASKKRFRWASEMDYLYGTSPRREASIAFDPVCGMPVADETGYEEQVGSHILRFCSLRCQLMWRRHDNRDS